MLQARRSERKIGGDILQACALLTVGVAVVGGLWVREFRSVGASVDRDTKTLAIDWLACGRRVSRVEFAAMAIIAPLKAVPSTRTPEQIQLLLPEGAAYDIVVKGGFVSPRKHNLRGELLRTHMAYAFEMSYRRFIESNDGRRIVERRQFGDVRMAKILASASDMRLALDTSERLLPAHIPFPTADAGISVADLNQVANSILASGKENALQSDASLALGEMDSLSGKSVRLTYLDGVGVESIEALDSRLTSDHLTWLFNQYVLPPKMPQATGRSSATRMKVSAQRLTTFSDLVKPPYDDLDLLLRPIFADNGSVRGFQVLRILSPAERREHAAGSPSSRRRAATAAIGAAHFDPGGTYIEDATIHWPYALLVACPERLPFESLLDDLQDEPTFEVRYHCQRR